MKKQIATSLLTLLTMSACSSAFDNTAGPDTSNTTGSSAAGSSATGSSTTGSSTATNTDSSATQAQSTTAPATQAGDEQLIRATTDNLGDPTPDTPADLAQQLKEGGLVIIHRYTGATRPRNADPAPAGFIDDGQRISESSVEAMQQLRATYGRLEIPIDKALASEYYFVYQHAAEAMPVPVAVHRDLTGSLNFSDSDELEASLQGLRDRTVTPPPAGTNTVLFTHQGKFDKAYGYFLNAGWTLILRPDGSGEPKVIASLPLEEFLALR